MNGCTFITKQKTMQKLTNKYNYFLFLIYVKKPKTSIYIQKEILKKY